jgi:hypothetical protein
MLGFNLVTWGTRRAMVHYLGDEVGYLGDEVRYLGDEVWQHHSTLHRHDLLQTIQGLLRPIISSLETQLTVRRETQLTVRRGTQLTVRQGTVHNTLY